MNKKAKIILKKIADKQGFDFNKLKKFYNTLGWDKKTILLSEGRKLR